MTDHLAGPKSSALAHLPSGKFTVNAAWLVLTVMAFNLARAAATLAGPGLARAITATIRRKLIAVPARIASSARVADVRAHVLDALTTEQIDHLSAIGDAILSRLDPGGKLTSRLPPGRQRG